MAQMSYDPTAADNIGAQVIEIGKAGLAAGSQAATSIIGMLPAGADEVSLQAASFFTQEAIKSLTTNLSALEELIRTGSAFQEIAKMIIAVDDGSAGNLAARAFNGGRALNGSDLMPRMATAMPTSGQPFMAGGVSPGGPIPPAQLARDSHMVKNDDEQSGAGSGAENAAASGPATGAATPIEPVTHVQPTAGRMEPDRAKIEL